MTPAQQLAEWHLAAAEDKRRNRTRPFNASLLSAAFLLLEVIQ